MRPKELIKLILLLTLFLTACYSLKRLNSYLNTDIVLHESELENLEAEFWQRNINKSVQNNGSSNIVMLVDLTTKLRPRRIYKHIKCRKSILYVVRTTLCVHNLEQDVHVSRSIWRNGVWEDHVLKPFVNYIYQNPDWLVIDVGAQIGQYSLFGAQMGLRVLAVEPFYDNILRLHKAARIEKLENKITVIQNAISNKRNEVKMLHQSQDNIGGQSLLNLRHQTFINNFRNKYLVRTILFDDLIPFLPRTNENKMYKKAILKIDIEGFEPYAFQHAAKLFEAIDIEIIFMEWGSLIKESSLHNYIVEMVEFLVKRNYSAYGNDQYLEPIKWGSWPAWDIIWKKNS